MDIVKQKKAPFYKNKKLAAVLGLGLFASAIYASTQFEVANKSIERNSILTASVEQGEFVITVAGPGLLVPRDVRWVASTVEGKVERILLKAGAQVKQGDLIAELNNPELNQKVEELNWEKEALEAELAALKVSHETKLLDMHAQFIATKMAYDKAKMRLDAESALIKRGNATVSKLDYESSKLTVEQLKKSLTIEKQREQQLKINLDASFKAQSARLNKLNKTIERAEFQLASLQVKAPTSGILQAMPLELGQRVALGNNVAKIARKDDLIAELKISELKASQVALGQSVTIDTRTSQISGEVMRIDPAVVDGTVQVDVALISALPSEARPDLSINGEVIVARKADALFVRRPAFSQANQTLPVFKIDQAGSYANKTNVRYGLASTSQIEIEHGLSRGDQIIVSEQSSFARHDKIALN